MWKSFFHDFFGTDSPSEFFIVIAININDMAFPGMELNAQLYA